MSRYTKKLGKCCPDCKKKGNAHSCLCHQFQWIKSLSHSETDEKFLVIRSEDLKFFKKYFISSGFHYADKAVKNGVGKVIK